MQDASPAQQAQPAQRSRVRACTGPGERIGVQDGRMSGLLAAMQDASPAQQAQPAHGVRGGVGR